MEPKLNKTDKKMVEAFMELMAEELDDENVDRPKVGIFWWDSEYGCFGVDYSYADDLCFVSSSLFDQKVRLSRMLHQQKWKKMKMRGRVPGRYAMVRYDMIPRGRVFQLEDGTFVVMHGKWLDEHPEAKADILAEFDLPVDKTRFQYYIHRDVGHNWDELMA